MPVTGSCGAEDLANLTLTALLEGEGFDVPSIDLNDAIYQLPAAHGLETPTRLTNDDITSGTVGGNGTFDVIINGVKTFFAAIGTDTRFVDGLPTALIKPMSGSGARGRI